MVEYLDLGACLGETLVRDVVDSKDVHCFPVALLRVCDHIDSMCHECGVEVLKGEALRFHRLCIANQHLDDDTEWLGGLPWGR